MAKGQLFMIRPNVYPTLETQKTKGTQDKKKGDEENVKEKKNYKFEQVQV